MMAAALGCVRFGGIAGLIALLMLLAGVAHAGTFGLQVGDEIVQMEWDALQSVTDDGATWDLSEGQLHADGRVTAVNLTAASPSAPALNPTDADMVFDLGLDAHDIFINPPQAFANATLSSFFVNIPSFQVFEGNVSVLSGQFGAGGVLIEGNIDLNSGSAILTGAGTINITGGDTQLVNALGGLGAGADVIISFSVFNFLPPLNTLVASGNIWGQDFSVSLSGTVSPFSSSPFVPEPSTALLLGGGLLGLLGVSRRVKKRA